MGGGMKSGGKIIYSVNLFVFGNCLVVWLIGDILLQSHGLENTIMPLQC